MKVILLKYMTKVIAFYIYVGSVLVSQPMKAQNNVVLDTVYFYDIAYKAKPLTVEFRGKIYTEALTVKFNNTDSIQLTASTREVNRKLSGVVPTSAEGVRIIYNRNIKTVITAYGIYNHYEFGIKKRTAPLSFSINTDTLIKNLWIVNFTLKIPSLSTNKLSMVTLVNNNTVIHRKLKNRRRGNAVQKALTENTTWEYNYVTGQLKRINE